MDNDPAGPPARHQPSGTRRKFLRQVGIGGAAAALIGLTEVAGLPSAQAAARNSPDGRPGARPYAACGRAWTPTRSAAL